MRVVRSGGGGGEKERKDWERGSVWAAGYGLRVDFITG